jgi:cytochrome d ubiquinol oxidase subunit II
VLLQAAAVAVLAGARPGLLARLGTPLALALSALLLLALAAIPIATVAGRVRAAFAASSAALALDVLLAACLAHPVLVPSTLGVDLALTVRNAASTPGTLRAMLAIAAVGVPLVAAYTFGIYRVFRGPVRARVE